jgi:hypothetical protein
VRTDCVLKHIIEWKIAVKIHVMGRRGRRHTQLLNDLTETRRYWKLKKDELDRNLWKLALEDATDLS